MEDIDISVLDNMIEKHVVEDDDAEKNKLLAGLSEAKQELDKFQGPISPAPPCVKSPFGP